MEWDKILGSLLGSSPLAGGLAFVAWTVWKKLEQKEAEHAKALEAEKAENERLQQARIDDLKEILRPTPKSQG